MRQTIPDAPCGLLNAIRPFGKRVSAGPILFMSELSNLRDCSTLPQFAHLLGVDARSLSFVLYWTDAHKKYTSFSIPKKGGGTRQITAPNPKLKFIQHKLSGLLSRIQSELETSRTRKNCVLAHGFKKSFSIVTNAQSHRNKRYVFNTDLKDYFPSINFGRVLGFFIKDRNFSLHPKIATIIAQIACHNNELPQGSPCSPVISNLITHILDLKLNKLAQSERCSYTRYADDLTFSTNEKQFPHSIARLVSGSSDKWVAGDKLIARIFRSGFRINELKTRMQHCDSRQDTTGLIVNKKINVRNEYYKQTRAMCHHLFTQGFCYIDIGSGPRPISDQKLEGRMSFIYQIRRLSVDNIKAEQPGFWHLYRNLLDYKSFVDTSRPRIVCEGKTDNIYLRAAIQSLHSKHPRLIVPGPKLDLSVSFFNYTHAAATFQELSGGGDELNKLLGSYRSRLSPFKFAPPHPVILVVDNDSGSTNLFKHLGKILGKIVGGTDPYYFVYHNLYVVPIPKSGPTAAIEDLFDPSLLAKKIGTKDFDRTGKQKDGSKWYGKFEFATQIVRKERATIDFTRFEPLLKAFEKVMDDYKVRYETELAKALAA